MQRQKIGIARDDMGGAPTDGQLQKLVIFGISARVDLFCWLHVKRSFNEDRKKLFSFGRRHVSLKFPTLKHLGQFLQGG